MIVSSEELLLDYWRARVGVHRRRVFTARPFAALRFVTFAPVCDGLVPLDKIVAVVCFDEPLWNGRVALRLKACAAFVEQETIVWGGETGTIRLKDLRLKPAFSATEFRVDLAEQWFLRAGLGLEREIHLRDRGRLAPNRQSFSLPRLWAGFRPFDAIQVRGDGADLDAEACRRRLPRATVFRRVTRAHGDLVLFPYGWLGADCPPDAGLFADLRGLPRCQVISLKSPEDLAGVAGPARFDFRNLRTSGEILWPSRDAPRPKQLPCTSCA